MSFSNTIVSFSLGSCSTIMGTHSLLFKAKASFHAQITSISWLPPKCKKYSTPEETGRFYAGWRCICGCFGGVGTMVNAWIYRYSRYPPSINPKSRTGCSYWYIIHILDLSDEFLNKTAVETRNHHYLQSVGKTVHDVLTEFH